MTYDGIINYCVFVKFQRLMRRFSRLFDTNHFLN